jgi:transposase InsO family protein
LFGVLSARDLGDLVWMGDAPKSGRVSRSIAGCGPGQDGSPIIDSLVSKVSLNRSIESFWATLQAEVLDRQHLADLAAADAAVTAYASYYNYHRLHGSLAWQTPAERFDGTPFTDLGFEHVPSLAGVADLLVELLAA